jgi:hypothetical protein
MRPDISDLSIQDAITYFASKLQADDERANTRPNTRPIEPPFEIDESLFIKDCTADLDSPCDCPACEKYERESMADALASYVPKKSVDDECDPDSPCDDPGCVTCHLDCEVNECEVCFEKAMDDAEWAVEAAKDREMGI